VSLKYIIKECIKNGKAIHCNNHNIYVNADYYL
jgi:hypothetical protein